MTSLSDLLSKNKTGPQKDMVSSMRKFTLGKNVERFLLSQVESPFVRFLHQYAMEQEKPVRKKREPQTREKEEATTSRRSDLKTIIAKVDDIKRSLLSIRKVIQSLQTSLQNITSSVVPPPDQSLQGSAAKMFATAGMGTDELFKPMTVSADDKEYLYYPGAPQGRQFYKKTKEGKAGFIAPSDKSQQLYQALAKKIDEIKSSISNNEESMTTTASPVGTILSSAKSNPELDYAPKDYGEVKEVDNKEEEELLQKALEKALRIVLPRVLSESGMKQNAGLGGDGLMGALGLAGIGTGIGAFAKKGVQALKGFGTKVGSFLAPKLFAKPATAAAAAAAPMIGDDLTKMAVQQATQEAAGATATTAATKAAQPVAAAAASKAATSKGIGSVLSAGKGFLGKSAAKLLPGVGLATSGYFAIERAKKGDYLGAGIDALSGVASLVPGIGTAAALALQGVNLGRDLTTPSATPNMISDDLQGSIIERTSSVNSSAQQAAPPVIINNNMTSGGQQASQPPPIEPIVSTRNSENSFLRAVSSDYIHPASAYKLT